MKSNWRQSTWGDEISLEYGRALKGYRDGEGEFRVYGSNGPVGWTSKSLASGPGVILGRKGAYRGVEYSVEPFYVIDTAYYVTPKSDLHMRWLYYAIIYHKLGDIDDGSPIPSTTRAAVYAREVDIPSKKEQNRIAHILGTLDDKIDLNRRMNRTLESMAQALFQSWFVDFDPVKAKLAALRHGRDPERACMAALSGKLRIAPGKPKSDTLDDQLPTVEEIDAAIAELDSLSPSQKENLTETAAHFPADFQESELGLVPEGWEVVSLESLTQIITKGTTPKKVDVANATDPALVNFIKVKDITAGGVINRDSLESIAQSIHTGPLKRSILKTDDLLYSIAGTIGRITIVDKDLDNSNCNQAIGFIRLKSPQQFLSLCLETLHSERVKEFISSQVVQAVQANASLTNLRQILIVVPSKETLDRWNTLANPCLIQRRELASQSRTLAELRDTLMPKLLSGELSVGEAASKTVEALP